MINISEEVKGGESMDSISGRTQLFAENDLYAADQDGIMSSILNGPDASFDDVKIWG